MPRPTPALPRILIAHPWMGRGGSEAVALWALQALQYRGDVTFATASPVNWADLNQAYGTHVDPSVFEVARFGKLPFVGRGDRIVTWQRAHFENHCRHIAPGFDLCISAYNPIDFGKPGIQLIGDFSFNEKARLLLYPNAEDQFCHRQSLLRRLYLSTETLLWGWRRPPLAERGDCAVANSFWTAARLERLFRLPATPVLYPPCPPPPPLDDAHRSPLRFVCLGRISPEKELETIIAILDAVRAKGYPVTLDLLGKIGNDQYCRRIRRLTDARCQWIRCPGFLGSREKAKLFRHATFAIHACRVEAFGIAVAEMAGAGLIPFVPHDGASQEIVSTPELIFKNGTDAVEKIITLIESPRLHAKFRDDLRIHCAQYRPDRFTASLVSLAERFIGHPLPVIDTRYPHVAASLTAAH